MCSCAAPPRPQPTTTTSPSSQPNSATKAAFERAEKAKPAPVRVGDRCRAKKLFARGSCAAGMACAPFPGGYCTARCERGARRCPGAGARCVDSPRAGELCMRRCKTSGDCRADQGYRCHRALRVCTLPRFVTLQPPRCAAKAPARGTWSEPLMLTSAAGPGYYQLEPTAALGADGRVVVAYVAAPKRGDKNTIGVSVLDAGGKIIVRERALSVGRESAYDPWIARDRRGRLSLVWLGFDGRRAPEKRMQVGLAHSADGATWSAPRAAHDDARDCRDKAGKPRPGCLDKPMIAIGRRPRGRRGEVLYVLYFSALHQGMRLRRSLDGGKTFSAAVTVAKGGAYGDVYVDARGELFVSYVAAPDPKRQPDVLGDTAYGVYLVRSVDGGKTFSAAQRVSRTDQPVPFFFSNAQVRHDSKRRLTYVVFPSGDRRGNWRIVLATRRDKDNAFTQRVLDDNDCAHHMVPSAALDRRGALHVAWYENRDGHGLVAYTRCSDGAKRCSAVERVSKARFASYDLVRHSPRWLGEYFALVVDDKRKRLHAVWTQTVSSGGKIRARIFYAQRGLVAQKAR